MTMVHQLLITMVNHGEIWLNMVRYSCVPGFLGHFAGKPKNSDVKIVVSG